MNSITIKIPEEPKFDKQAYDIIRARMIYLETPECRMIMCKSKIDEERKKATEKFKRLIQCPNYPNDTTISHW